MLKQQGAVERLIHLDEGFKFLRALRASPLLWESKGRFVCKDKTVGSCNSLLQFVVCRNTVDISSKNSWKLLDNKDYCDSELFNQPLYFCAAYLKFSNWQASYYLNQTTVLSLRHPNLPCMYSHKISLPLIYIASCQKSTPSQHMYPMGTYFFIRCKPV